MERGEFGRGDERKSDGRGELKASFGAGVAALVFLVIGYQTALFVHRTAVMKIVSDRTFPDTVYVIDSVLAEKVLGNRSPSDLSSLKGRDVGQSAYVVRKESEIPEEATEILSGSGRKKVESFRFNPNTVSGNDLVRLGFSMKQAEAILNYREKGGRFRRKSDFSKSFVVSDSIYRRLEPYLDIPRTDINLADSAAFDDLPGIGPYFAAKMISYRNRLGGSYSYPEQLMDIYNFDRSRYDGLADLICVDTSFVRPYPMWTLPEDSLRKHPYIGSYAARGIVIYRENTPSSEWSVKALEENGILDPEKAAKLGRCRIAPPPDSF